MNNKDYIDEIQKQCKATNNDLVNIRIATDGTVRCDIGQHSTNSFADLAEQLGVDNLWTDETAHTREFLYHGILVFEL